MKTHIEDEFQGELCREQDVTVKAETVETDPETVEKEMNDAKDSIDNIDGDLSLRTSNDC